jgi:hypothetical protein
VAARCWSVSLVVVAAAAVDTSKAGAISVGQDLAGFSVGLSEHCAVAALKVGQFRFQFV